MSVSSKFLLGLFVAGVITLSLFAWNLAKKKAEAPKEVIEEVPKE